MTHSLTAASTNALSEDARHFLESEKTFDPIKNWNI